LETINRHNYELFFLDFLDGNLSEKELKDLNRFLKQNPDLKEELEGFEDVRLEPTPVVFKNKRDLIKKTQAQHFEITEFEYLCIADIEKDINSEEKKQLQSELLNSNKKKEFFLFEKTKLEADNCIVYFAKSDLYKRVIAFGYKSVISVAAAAVILLFFLFGNDVFTGNDKENPKPKFAEEIQQNSVKEPIQKIIKTDLYEKNLTQQEQVLVTHNQTIKNSTNNVLAFDDNEPQKVNDLYKELIVSIPDIKNEALISNINQKIIPVNFTKPYTSENAISTIINKDKFWKYAEKGVDVWKKITKDEDIQLKNEYAENGSVNEVNFMASNFQFRKTYNKK